MDRRRRPPLIAGGLPLLIGALRAIHRRGLVVGRDLALVGWDDGPLTGAFPAGDRCRRPRCARAWRGGRDAGAEAAGLWRRPRRQPAPRRDPCDEVHPAGLERDGSALGFRRQSKPERRISRMIELFSFADGRRALVTGGAGGLGLGAARRLLGSGATVAIADLPAALDRMAPQEGGPVRAGRDGCHRRRVGRRRRRRRRGAARRARHAGQFRRRLPVPRA